MPLVELTVTNLAVVESVRLPLGRGFTVLTGETGAGKSLVVDAVALALGARAVLVGRAALYGLAVGGAPGVQQVLELLSDEVQLGLALLGCASPAEVGPDHVTAP